MSKEDYEVSLTAAYPHKCDRVRAVALYDGGVALLTEVAGDPVRRPVILTREEWRRLNDGVTAMFENYPDAADLAG